MADPNAASPSAPRGPSTLGSFFNHLRVMPKLHKRVLGLAVLLAGAGTAGRVSDYFSTDPQMSLSATATMPSDTPTNSIVAEPSTAAPPAAPERDPTMTQRLSPVAQKLGIGFIAGFVIGWIFRAFVKVMSLITLAGVALFGALAYFDVDMSGWKAKFESGMGWVTEQGQSLADKAMNRVPGSAAGVTGMFFGFRRRR